MDPSERSEDEVGYGKPPKKSQFQKGASGNPKGRPKGSRNLSTQLTRILGEKVIVNENGRRKPITKLEAALKQQVNKAASGDLKALQMLVSLLRSFEEVGGDAGARTAVPEEDRKLMLSFFERYEKDKISGDDHETDSE